MNNVLLCSVCKFDYTHFIGTIQVTDNDEYQAYEFIVNQKFPITVKTKYEYRSQGNLHLLFRCEDGHFFIKSFDGHKGNIFIDNNQLMDELASYLNEVYKEEEKRSLSFDYELLGNIEKFLFSKKID